MAASVQTSGSVNVGTAASGSEQDFATVTAAGVYVCVADLAALVDEERMVLRVYGKARSTDTERLIHVARYVGHTIVTPLVQSIAVVSPHSLRFAYELETTSAATRAIPWAIYAT